MVRRRRPSCFRIRFAIAHDAVGAEVLEVSGLRFRVAAPRQVCGSTTLLRPLPRESSSSTW